MGFVTILAMVFFEWVDNCFNRKGIDPKMYGDVPDPWNDYLRSKGRK